MWRKVGVAGIAVLGLMSLAAVPAEAGDTTPCPAGTVRVVVSQFCFGGLLSTSTCQDITACRRLVLHVPHRPTQALLPPPKAHPLPGPALSAHPVRKLR